MSTITRITIILFSISIIGCSSRHNTDLSATNKSTSVYAYAHEEKIRHNIQDNIEQGKKAEENNSFSSQLSQNVMESILKAIFRIDE